MSIVFLEIKIIFLFSEVTVLLSYSERVALCISQSHREVSCMSSVRYQALPRAYRRRQYPRAFPRDRKDASRKHTCNRFFRAARERRPRAGHRPPRPSRKTSRRTEQDCQNDTCQAYPPPNGTPPRASGHIPGRLPAREKSENIPDNRHFCRHSRNRQTEPEHHLRRLKSPRRNTVFPPLFGPVRI